MPSKLNLKGKRFSRLLALESTHLPYRTAWLCLCDCGVKKVVATSSLTAGLTKSCGCWHLEQVRNKAIKHRTHGQRNTLTYKTWISMRCRCSAKSGRFQKYYYLAGIRVCKRWHKFENFLADMGPKPPGLSLDRINSTKGYSRANCRWATLQQQNQNRKGCIWFRYKNEKLNLREWSRRLGIDSATLYRGHQRGWSLRKIIQQYEKRLARLELPG